MLSPETSRWQRKYNSHSTTDPKTGVVPSFVFLQLYHMGMLHCSSLPIPIPDNNEDFSRGLKNLERIAPYETHKIGVVYIGHHQSDSEVAILANTYGSERYSLFLKQLGTLVALKNCDPREVFIGGLDHEEDEDGKYTYMWHDEVVQMVFHIATMMPTKENDKNCNNKKRHIGNDYVTVVYNDSGEKYALGTIKGQFNYVNIVVEPLDKVSHAVSVLCKDEIKKILEPVSTKVISDAHVADLVKQVALHSSMASKIYERLKKDELFASNWLERLRQIKRMKEKIPPRKRTNDNEALVTDFTEYV